MTVWRHGDSLVVAIALFFTLWLATSLWQHDGATQAVVYADGQVASTVDLAATRTIRVPGPLGDTVIEVANGRARIASDPSPRQYCVQAGWLSRAGDSAICLPNRTALVLENRLSQHDSLSY
ncbi:NusG domain II-containing protein [Chitinibacteraceae bacterium HSL-7]